MSFLDIPPKWKEWFGSGTFPELLELFQKQLEMKKNSRIIIKKNEVKWDNRHPQAKTASLVDSRLGFANSIANLGLSEIDPGSKTGKHKHSEALVYILNGKGYSVIGDKKYEWEEGDALYIPPDTYHQHFNLDSQKPARFLRVVPGPIQLNLLALAASLNLVPPYSMEVAEVKPGLEGKAEEIKAYMKGESAKTRE